MLISEDVITAMARFPPELRLTIIQYAPEPEWDQYVTGRYNETKKEDNQLLGGGKPLIRSNAARSAMQWKVDEDDMPDMDTDERTKSAANNDTTRGEFRRASSVGPSSSVSQTADFGSAPMDDDDDDDDDDDNISSGRAPHVSLFICRGINLSLTLRSLHDIWHKKWHHRTILVRQTKMTRKRAGSLNPPSA